MNSLEFRCKDESPVRFEDEKVIVDYDEAGSIIAVEILGYSYISGRLPAESDLVWLKDQVLSLGCDEELDVLTLQTAYETNAGQKSVRAIFGFDTGGRLLSLTIPESDD